MKRSAINGAIKGALSLLEENHLRLPMFGYWSPEDWRANKDRISDVRKTMLGWDVTDFGRGDFDRIGAVLFTIRNGTKEEPATGTPYAEKLIFLKHETQQEIPMHFHSQKTEDIINRGGGIMVIQLYNSAPGGRLDETGPVEVYMDGLRHTFPAGALVEVEKGNSITLTPGLYHRFWAKKGYGDLICGEVSSVNDDTADNTFLVETERFTPTKEDEDIRYPLGNEFEFILGR